MSAFADVVSGAAMSGALRRADQPTMAVIYPPGGGVHMASFAADLIVSSRIPFYDVQSRRSSGR